MADRTVLGRYVSATAVNSPQTIDFGRPMGAIYLRNKGPNDCYVAFDGIATGVDADNQPLVSAGEAINLVDVQIRRISVFMVAGAGALSRVDALGSIAVPQS